MIKSWDYIKYYKIHKNKILQIINKVFLSGKLILGPELEKFEKNFSKFIGTKYAVGVGNCTDAIYISLKALNLKKNSEVITVSNTAIPTITAIVNAGAVPRFVDVNEFYLMDVNKIEKLINKKTKVIIPVHLYGQVCEMKKIIQLAKKYNLKIIEDCAQATGAKQNTKKAGSFGDTGCFSFYPTKVLGAFGDGGMITTNNYKLYKKILKIRYMGIESKNYYASTNGTNSRLDEIQAAILDYKLKDLEKNILKRNKIARIYNHNLKNTDLILPKISKNNSHSYYEYVVSYKKRNFLMKELKRRKIFTKITYPFPVHNMKPYLQYYKNENLDNTISFSKKIFSLPIYPELSMSQVNKIIFNIKKIL